MSERAREDLQNPWSRASIVLASLCAAIVMLWWRGPEWGLVADAFRLVEWTYIFAAIGLNLLSVVARALAWRTVVNEALRERSPPFVSIFSAFGIGLLANAVLPARTGELARVAVLTRRLPRGRGYTATLLGTVFTHRLFDVIPAMLLVVYVLLTAKIPHWALTSIAIAAAIGGILLVVALITSRLASRSSTSSAASGASLRWRAWGLTSCAHPRGWRSQSSSSVSAGCSSCSPCGSRCARSTSTRRCPPRDSCSC